MAFGSYIRKKREEAGMTLTDFARRIDISPAYWSRIEREMEKAPKDDLIERPRRPRAGLDELFIEASRLPPDMQRDVAGVVHAYRKLKPEDRFGLPSRHLLPPQPGTGGRFSRATSVAACVARDVRQQLARRRPRARARSGRLTWVRACGSTTSPIDLDWSTDARGHGRSRQPGAGCLRA